MIPDTTSWLSVRYHGNVTGVCLSLINLGLDSDSVQPDTRTVSARGAQITDSLVPRYMMLRKGR